MSTKKRTSSKKKNTNIYYIVGAVVAALIVAGVLVGVSLNSDDGSGTADADTAAEVRRNMDGIPASGLVLGEPDAPVTITEFADVACPHCRTAALNTVPTVVTDLVRTGQAKLEFVPTVFISASSERGALGILAAAEQDAGWQFAEMLFHIQGNEATDWLTDADLEEIATSLDLDVDAWRAAYEGSEVVADYNAATAAVTAAGITSTPTFIVSGPGGEKTLPGAVPASDIAAAVEQVSSPS